MNQPAPDTTDSAHTAGHRRAVMMGTAALVVLMAVSALAWFLIDGTPGLYGALIGAAIGGVFALITGITMVMTASASPTTTAAVLLGTWLLKLLALLGIVAALKPLDFYSTPALGVTIIIAMLTVLAAETMSVLRTKAPYIDA